MAKGIDRDTVYKKFNGHCAYCGVYIKKAEMQVDHVIPKMNFIQSVRNKHHIPEFLLHLTELDVDHIDNLMPSCRSCNNYKNTFHLELFRHELGELVKRINKTSSIYRIAKRFGNIIEIDKPIKFYFEQWLNR